MLGTSENNIYAKGKTTQVYLYVDDLRENLI